MQVTRLATELQARHHEVTVLSLTGPDDLSDELAKAGVDHKPIGLSPTAKSLPRAVWSLVTLPLYLRRQRFDVVHAVLFWAHVAVLPAAALARIPLRILGTRNLATDLRKGPLRRAGHRLSQHSAHLVVANADAVARAFETHVGPPGRLEVIPNGVDIPPEPAEPGREPPVGVVIANFLRYKGHADLAEALRKVDARVVIHAYGDGPERGSIQRLVSSAGLTGRMVIHGTTRNAQRIYAEAQFAILPSHEEGFPNTVLEAMATGLPVVATRVGGSASLIDEGETGFLVRPHAPTELALAIQRLASDPSLRVRMGRAARDRARLYSWDLCVRRHEDLYRSAAQLPT